MNNKHSCWVDNIPTVCSSCGKGNLRIGNNFFAPNPPQGYAECMSCGSTHLIKAKIKYDHKTNKFKES